MSLELFHKNENVPTLSENKKGFGCIFLNLSASLATLVGEIKVESQGAC